MNTPGTRATIAHLRRIRRLCVELEQSLLESTAAGQRPRDPLGQFAPVSTVTPGDMRRAYGSESARRAVAGLLPGDRSPSSSEQTRNEAVLASLLQRMSRGKRERIVASINTPFPLP